MKLPKIYEYFKLGDLFTIADAELVLNISGQSLRRYLSNLLVKKQIIQIRHAMYRLVNNEDDFYSSLTCYAIAMKLSSKCYISYGSALKFYANKELENKDVLHIVSITKFNFFIYKNITYQYCQGFQEIGLNYIKIIDHNMHFILVITSFEKTIVDCIKRPANAPSLEEIIKICTEINFKPNFDLILEYCAIEERSASYNRLGLLLTKMQEKWDIPEHIFNEINKKMSKKPINWLKKNTKNTNNISITLVEYDFYARWKVNSKSINKNNKSSNILH